MGEKRVKESIKKDTPDLFFGLEDEGYSFWGQSRGHWCEYKNGNTKVRINTQSGTRFLRTEADEFNLKFPLNMDILISTKCDNECPYCYAGCNRNGQHAKLFHWKFWENIQPYTEVAINLNYPLHPDLHRFLWFMKSKKVFVNVTINQRDFERLDVYQMLMDWNRDGLIHGIGISVYNRLTDRDDLFVHSLAPFLRHHSVTLHVIAGLIDYKKLRYLLDGQLPILILGYKAVRNGLTYSQTNENNKQIRENISKLRKNMIYIFGNDQYLINFDNLAIQQLNLRSIVSEDTWNLFYAGKEGSTTFAMNLVDGTYSLTSMSEETYPIGTKSINEMFGDLKRKYNV